MNDNASTDEATTDVIDGLAGADAGQLAAVVAAASDEQLAEGLSDPEARKKALDEIFTRMADHAEPDKLKGIDAIVHFTITDKPGGGEDTYEVVLADGAVQVNEAPTTDSPKVSLKIGPVPFLRLVTGAASGPTLFMTGKLKLGGDVMFASQMTSLFRIPKG